MKNKDILFIKSRKKQQCASFKKYTMLKTSTSSITNKKLILIKAASSRFNTVSKDQHVILFGIRDINNGIETENGSIQSQWFEEQKETSILFVPRGLGLFKDAGWKSKFEKFVTFSGIFEFLSDDLEIIQENAPILFIKLLKEVKTETDPEGIKDALTRVYLNEIENLYISHEGNKRKYNSSDVLVYASKMKHNVINMVVSTA